MKREISRAEWIRQLERKSRTLRHSNLDGIERDRHRRSREPGALAAVAGRELAKLLLQTLLRFRRAVLDERTNRICERIVRWRWNESAIIRVSIAVDVARNHRRIR